MNASMAYDGNKKGILSFFRKKTGIETVNNKSNFMIKSEDAGMCRVKKEFDEKNMTPIWEVGFSKKETLTTLYNWSANEKINATHETFAKGRVNYNSLINEINRKKACMESWIENNL